MIYVIFGSQTGNSEEIAKRINKEIKQKLKTDNCELIVMNKFLQTIQKFPENKNIQNIVIAVCSTTGAGDAPTNCENFMRWIKRKTHSNDILNNVHFCILGLGDSNYTKYQFVPRQFDEYFGKLGGHKFYAKGEADDAYGLEIVVEPWIEGLYPKLENLWLELSKENQSYYINNDSSNNTIDIENKNKTLDTGINKNEKIEINFSNSQTNNSNIPLYANGKILSKKIISGTKSEKEIYSIELEITEDFSNRNSDINFSNYPPGSYVSIIPTEDPQKLEKIKNVINIFDKYLLIDKSHHFNIYSDFYEKFPHFEKILHKGYFTFEEIFNYVIDFSSILKKLQVDNIRNLLKNKLQNIEILNKLEQIFTKYTDLVLKNKISLYDILSCLEPFKIKINLTLLEMIEFFPIKYPRNYSLCSCPNNGNNKLEIVFSVVNERTIRKFTTIPQIKPNEMLIKPGEFYFKGQSSNYMKNQKINEKILISNISNCFSFPQEEFLGNNKPILYLCNGTGISPCISFLKDIKILVQNKNEKINPSTIGEFFILTGFRSDSKEKNETIHEDFIKETINYINYNIQRNDHKKVFTYERCVSNCEDNEEEECGIWRNCRINSSYVQDLILEHEDTIYDIIFNQDGYLMICGDVDKLFEECMENIMAVYMNRNNLSRERSVRYMEEMKLKNKIIVEKWI